MRTSRWYLLILIAACKREVPAPPASTPSASPPPTPSAAPAFVQLRPRDHSLGDPATANPRMTFDLAVGAVGLLQVELVDRVGNTRAMELGRPDPRCIFIGAHEIKPPRVTLETKFVNQNGVLTFVMSTQASGGRTENTAPIPSARRPSPGARLKADVIAGPAMLPLGNYVPIVGFAWSSPDASIANALVVDEVAPEPQWIVRVQFRIGT